MRVRAMSIVWLTAVIATAPLSALASDDPFTDRQWNMRLVHAEKAWSTERGEGMVIAIVDTGVDRRHGDLKSNLVPGYDFVDGDSDPSDENGHGTHVAGIAAARANNEIGVAGVAPAAKIMPIRVLDEEGSGYGDDIDEGVRWAVDHGADVVNLSLGGDILIENLFGGTLTDTVDYAWSRGVVPVIAAGNEGFFRTELADANTIIVTATTRDDELASYATEIGFAKWGMAAPGGDDEGGTQNLVYSTFWTKARGSGYGWGQGTSMAAPHVAGAAAILRAAGLSPQQTVDRLLSSAADLGASGDDFTYGHGRVDVGAAVAGLAKSSGPKDTSASGDVEPDDDTPAAAPSAPSRPGAGSTPRSTQRTTAPTDAPASDVPSTSTPSGRVLASEEEEDGSSGLPALAVAGVVLAGIAGLLAYGRMRQLRSGG